MVIPPPRSGSALGAPGDRRRHDADQPGTTQKSGTSPTLPGAQSVEKRGGDSATMPTNGASNAAPHAPTAMSRDPASRSTAVCSITRGSVIVNPSTERGEEEARVAQSTPSGADALAGRHTAGRHTAGDRECPPPTSTQGSTLADDAIKRLRRMPAGLNNEPFNTCFMAAALQCLLRIPAFVVHFSKMMDEGDVVPNSDVTNAFRALVRRALESGPGSSIDIGALATGEVLKAISETFEPGRQEDAHEYILKLLECLDDEEEELRGDRAHNTLAAGMERATAMRQSFSGWTRQTLVCSECERTSLTFDRMLDITINMASQSSAGGCLSVASSIATIMSSETMGECRCESCGAIGSCTKHTKIDVSPNVLVIGCKRFQTDGSKIARHVAFGPTLDLAPFVFTGATREGNHAPANEYRLTGVVVHENVNNSADSGHYVAFVRLGDGSWCKCDDAGVEKTDVVTVLSQEAYVLFYEHEAVGGAPMVQTDEKQHVPNHKTIVAADIAAEPAAADSTAALTMLSQPRYPQHLADDETDDDDGERVSSPKRGLAPSPQHGKGGEEEEEEEEEKKESDGVCFDGRELQSTHELTSSESRGAGRQTNHRPSSAGVAGYVRRVFKGVRSAVRVVTQGFAFGVGRWSPHLHAFRGSGSASTDGTKAARDDQPSGGGRGTKRKAPSVDSFVVWARSLIPLAPWRWGSGGAPAESSPESEPVEAPESESDEATPNKRRRVNLPPPAKRRGGRRMREPRRSPRKRSLLTGEKSSPGSDSDVSADERGDSAEAPNAAGTTAVPSDEEHPVATNEEAQNLPTGNETTPRQKLPSPADGTTSSPSPTAAEREAPPVVTGFAPTGDGVDGNDAAEEDGDDNVDDQDDMDWEPPPVVSASDDDDDDDARNEAGAEVAAAPAPGAGAEAAAAAVQAAAAPTPGAAAEAAAAAAQRAPAEAAAAAAPGAAAEAAVAAAPGGRSSRRVRVAQPRPRQPAPQTEPDEERMPAQTDRRHTTATSEPRTSSSTRKRNRGADEDAKKRRGKRKDPHARVNREGDFARRIGDLLKKRTKTMDDAKKTPEERESEEAHAVKEAERKAAEDEEAMKEAERKWHAAEKDFDSRRAPYSSDEYMKVIAKRQKDQLEDWQRQRKAGQDTTPKPKFKNNIKLSSYEKDRVSRLDPKWRGIIAACIKCSWPFPMVFRVKQLAKLDDTIADMHAEYPQMKTLHELCIFLGEVFSDGSFDKTRLTLSTNNPAHARAIRDATPSALWREHEGKEVAEDDFEEEGEEIVFVEGEAEDGEEEVEEEEEEGQEEVVEDEEGQGEVVEDEEGQEEVVEEEEGEEEVEEEEEDVDSIYDPDEEETDDEEEEADEEDDDEEEEEEHARELKVTADGMRIHDKKSSNNASSRHYIITSEVAALKTAARFYEPTRARKSTGSGAKRRQLETAVKKCVPVDWLGKSRRIITLALTATPAFTAALWVGDGSVKHDRLSVALCDFTDEEQRWFVHIHKQRTWRDGTTGEEIHGGWPMEMQRARTHFHLMASAKALEADGYRALHGSVCRSATRRYLALHASLPPRYQVLRAYPHKLHVAEDINHLRAAKQKRYDGSEQPEDHVLYRMRMLEGKSFAEIKEYVRGKGFGSTWVDSRLRERLLNLGACPPVSATGEEKTGNTQRATHSIHDVRVINERFTSLDDGGEEAEKLGGLRRGGEASLKHFKKTLGWALERDAYVIDWETYTCIFPGRMTGTDTKFTNKERDAQRTFFKRMKESSSSSSSGGSAIVNLCAKQSPEILKDRLHHVLQPKPKSSEDIRRNALLSKGWIKKLSPRPMFFHEPSGYSVLEIARAEHFRNSYDRILDLGWTVKPHQTDKKPVFIPPKNENENETKKNKKKEYRRMEEVTRYLKSKA